MKTQTKSLLPRANTLIAVVLLSLLATAGGQSAPFDPGLQPSNPPAPTSTPPVTEPTQATTPTTTTSVGDPFIPSTPAPVAVTPTRPATYEGPTTTYIVRQGQNLFRIALLLQVPMDYIMSLNNLKSPKFLFTGQVLIVPDGKLQFEPLSQPS